MPIRPDTAQEVNVMSYILDLRDLDPAASEQHCFSAISVS
jgi:hypothetical protein